ncbi:hypothetical protein MGYG_02339 [Nannizzia gypsea CBS 118893]|uniref:Protein kinase domain-containing protein n=1 Tax=Arthroderma gypseum (strain ATCC MYA-4604 / CBS 118893) TaxID=535722 RepID=E4UR51_ARTGP|nr:hypothetical protein MGYG_02339 [Nannizzia gypsea CBS 118893]EFQ99326.1 hypothetical protein MGYG_02339 [Nannizzia gypsea CBS 118893]
MSSFMDDSMIGRWLSDLLMDDLTRKSTSKPQLRRFIHHEKPIRYIRCLGGGTEGDVYLVEIEGHKYALKVFKQWKFDAPKSIRLRLKERETHYFSPIANEARAFARLDSMGQNGTWAVKCHGWMKLSGKQRPRFLSLHTPWAIVKDYIPDPMTLDDVPEIRQKMKIARKALLFPDDAQPRNYRGSFLVDLGRVKTHPYPRVLWSKKEYRKYFECFDKDASEWVESVQDGEVIDGWVNEYLKEGMLKGIIWAEKRGMYAEAENLRKLIEKTLPLYYFLAG